MTNPHVTYTDPYFELLWHRDTFLGTEASDETIAYVDRWCESNGYTEPFHQEGQWWAFPSNAVMPVLIDALITREIVLEDFSCRCIPLIQDGTC